MHNKYVFIGADPGRRMVPRGPIRRSVTPAPPPGRPPISAIWEANELRSNPNQPVSARCDSGSV